MEAGCRDVQSSGRPGRSGALDGAGQPDTTGAATLVTAARAPWTVAPGLNAHRRFLREEGEGAYDGLSSSPAD